MIFGLFAMSISPREAVTIISVRVCMYVCICMYVHMNVRACVRACLRACDACNYNYTHNYIII